MVEAMPTRTFVTHLCRQFDLQIADRLFSLRFQADEENNS
jgi:hypothetical protein